MACRRSLCICCIIFLTFVSAILATLIILSYVGVEPRFYLQQIYVPALNNSANLNSTSVSMDLKFKRVVAFAPIRYEDINITLYYGSVVGYGVVPGFYQGRKKTARRRVVVDAPGPPWDDAIRNISRGSTVLVLKVELTTKYRLRECDGDGDCSFTKAKAVVVAADVAVDHSGDKVSQKPIRLR